MIFSIISPLSTIYIWLNLNLWLLFGHKRLTIIFLLTVDFIHLFVDENFWVIVLVNDLILGIDWVIVLSFLVLCKVVATAAGVVLDVGELVVVVGVCVVELLLELFD